MALSCQILRSEKPALPPFQRLRAATTSRRGCLRVTQRVFVHSRVAPSLAVRLLIEGGPKGGPDENQAHAGRGRVRRAGPGFRVSSTILSRQGSGSPRRGGGSG